MGSLPNLSALGHSEVHTPIRPHRLSAPPRRHQQGSPVPSTQSSVRGGVSCNRCGGRRDSLSSSSSSVRRLIALVRATPSQFGPAFSERALARSHAALCLGHATFAAALVPLLSLHTLALKSEITAASLLAACFLTAALSSLAAPLLLLPARKPQFALPACYLLAAIGVGTYLYPTVYTLVPGFLLLGLALGPLGHLQASFLFTISAKFAFVSEEPRALVQARLARHFYASHSLGHAVGSAAAGLLLWHQVIDVDLKCESCPPWPPVLGFERGLSCKATTMIFSVCLGCTLMAVALSATFLEPIAQQCAREPVLSVLRSFRDSRMRFLAPLFFFIGLQHIFLLTEYSKWFVACGLGTAHVCLALVGSGVLQAIAGSTLSLLIQHVPRSLVIAVGLVFHSCLLLALTAWRPSRDDAALFYVISAAWGVCSAIWETLAFALLSTLHAETWRAPLAQSLFYRHLGSLLACILHPLLCVRTKLMTLAALLIAAVASVLALERCLTKNRRFQLQRRCGTSCKAS